MKQVYRQGDVVITAGIAVPKDAKVCTHRILAHGEVTGHKHQVTEGDAVLYEHDGKLYLHVEGDSAILTHEEHGPITLPHGDYGVVIQREYEPDGWRNVAD